ncbi:MAG: hypothetical protein LKM32_11480 [Chiayiivirga sp.]|jgi:hypothetical protein|uniref:hypothetical protein n=1 Tax=Chiayiivirga sp. TaxID=2041042 RepID=UPI0025C4D903|nr:hypothetical protein [Chiayiivirga sp.]MCI1729970.1 hypothetical protein [Chiayiivirga sp.]
MNDDSADVALMTRIRARLPVDGPTLGRNAFEAGLAVTRPDGHRQPIPVGAMPVILDDAEIMRRAALARHLVAATARTARWLMAGSNRHLVLAALSPVERRLVEATWSHTNALAVARVDFLVNAVPLALEVNATIPAMQGYSDIAAEQWLRTFAADRPDLDDLIHRNGSNTAALLDALREIHAQRRDEPLSHLGVLCRRGDAQLTELEHLAAQFEASGVETQLVFPDQLSLQAGFLVCNHRPVSLLYRHLFLSRLEAMPSPALEAALAAPGDCRTVVLNPPAPHLEMKSTLAWLSRSQEDEALAHAIGLRPQERAAIASSLPWTRCLSELGGDTLEGIAAQPDDYVLKRNWSYGGKDVFVGRSRHQPDFWSRAQGSFAGVTGWPDLCARAADDRRGGGFVVQRAVATQRREQYLCTPDAVHRAEVVTDYAAYASLGSVAPWGGVCRAAASDVVNIVGGGGVVPLLRRSVVERLAL